MALGARRRDVLRLILRQGFIMVVIGAVVGLAAGFAGGRFISHLLFGLPESDPVVFLATTGLLVAVSLLAIYIPARRATRIKPMIALRHE
jgi:ABC-type antimicrobial peptide transport system permease subunit